MPDPIRRKLTQNRPKVKIAAQNKIPFLATTNGHGTSTGYGDVQNALNINLGNFNKVSVDATDNRLTAGGGVKFGDLFGPLSDAGKVMRRSSRLSPPSLYPINVSGLTMN